MNPRTETLTKAEQLESHPHRYHRTALIFALIAGIQTINLLICLL